jgi:hypothetical protein
VGEDSKDELELTLHASHVARERQIHIDWIVAAVKQPEKVLVDLSDHRLSACYRRVPEFGNRVLKVVCDLNRHPPRIITAYFDRSARMDDDNEAAL